MIDTIIIVTCKIAGAAAIAGPLMWAGVKGIEYSFCRRHVFALGMLYLFGRLPASRDIIEKYYHEAIESLGKRQAKADELARSSLDRKTSRTQKEGEQ